MYIWIYRFVFLDVFSKVVVFSRILGYFVSDIIFEYKILKEILVFKICKYAFFLIFFNC